MDKAVALVTCLLFYAFPLLFIVLAVTLTGAEIESLNEPIQKLMSWTERKLHRFSKGLIMGVLMVQIFLCVFCSPFIIYGNFVFRFLRRSHQLFRSRKPLANTTPTTNVRAEPEMVLCHTCQNDPEVHALHLKLLVAENEVARLAEPYEKACYVKDTIREEFLRVKAERLQSEHFRSALPNAPAPSTNKH